MMGEEDNDQIVFIRQRKNRLVAGVVAGLADKFGWDLALARILLSFS